MLDIAPFSIARHFYSRQDDETQYYLDHCTIEALPDRHILKIKTRCRRTGQMLWNHRGAIVDATGYYVQLDAPGRMVWLLVPQEEPSVSFVPI